MRESRTIGTDDENVEILRFFIVRVVRETGIGGLAGTPTGCKIAEIVTMSADTEEKD